MTSCESRLTREQACPSSLPTATLNRDILAA